MNNSDRKKIFTLLNKDNGCAARLGILKLEHSEIETPVFMPVGTQASVKTLTPDELTDIGFQIILSNTYHLYLRPGVEVIEVQNGLHKFMNWKRSILTDSGGFQVFSLADLRKYNEDGVHFSSHIDGSKHFFTPEKSVDLQQRYGSDIAMVLDICAKYPSTEKESAEAKNITTKWAKRCKNTANHPYQKQFGIVQGNVFKNLRRESTDELVELDFDGYAVGGLSVGEPADIRNEVLSYSVDWLPHEKPRYLMGVGAPLDILEGVFYGIDMFDCVLPTRNARNGQLLTEYGPKNIKNTEFKNDSKPVSENCGCYACRNFSRSYMRHLFKAGETLVLRLNSIHNLYFLHNLMKDIRTAIKENRFSSFKKDFTYKYTSKTNNADFL